MTGAVPMMWATAEVDSPSSSDLDRALAGHGAPGIIARGEDGRGRNGDFSLGQLVGQRPGCGSRVTMQTWLDRIPSVRWSRQCAAGWPHQTCPRLHWI